MRIVKYPHPALRHKSRELKRVDAELRKAIAEMFELMYQFRGIGLAANQVDLPYRVFILNVTGDAAAKDEELVLINPTILKWSGNAEAEEGCLSFPEIYAPVRRPSGSSPWPMISPARRSDTRSTACSARAIQHENDHLDGKPGAIAAMSLSVMNSRCGVCWSCRVVQAGDDGMKRRWWELDVEGQGEHGDLFKRMNPQQYHH